MVAHTQVPYEDDENFTHISSGELKVGRNVDMGNERSTNWHENEILRLILTETAMFSSASCFRRILVPSSILLSLLFEPLKSKNGMWVI